MTSRLVVVALIVVALCSGCGTRQYYSAPYSPPYSTSQPPPPRITEETKPHSAVRLVSVIPVMGVPETKVTVDRYYKEQTEWFPYSEWRTSRSARYIPKGSIIVRDRDVQFGFGFSSMALTSSERAGTEFITTSPLGLSLLVRNGSNSAIVVDWNAVTLIDTQGRSYGVLHRGVKMSDTAIVMAPSTIPPGAILEDFVYPKELLSFSGSGWIGESFFERIPNGERFSLYLPVKRGPETIEYQFKFEVLVPDATKPARADSERRAPADEAIDCVLCASGTSR